MKRKYIPLFSLILVFGILTFVVINRWSTWFHNEPELVVTYTATPHRIVLSTGEEFDSQRTISWLCDTVLAKQAYVELATPTDTTTIQAFGTVVQSRGGKGAYYRAELDNLTSTTYSYRVVCDEAASSWYPFTMPAAQSDTLSFLYIGDIQDRLTDITTPYFAKIAARFPDAQFWALAGDIIERPIDAYWEYWMKGMTHIAPSIPLVATPGNHEYMKGIVGTVDPRWEHTFAAPRNGAEGDTGQSYYFETPELCFVVLNSNVWGNPIALWQQYRWAKKVLSSSDKKWKMALFHHPTYALKKGRSNSLVHRPFKYLFEHYGVQLVLQGHDHGYSRSSTHGGTPLYFVSSCSPKVYEAEKKPIHDKIGEGLHLVQHIEIVGDTLHYKSYQIDGTLFDWVEVVSSGEVIDKSQTL